jgi:DNA-binding IclR family transcriptional regulator
MTNAKDSSNADGHGLHAVAVTLALLNRLGETQGMSDAELAAAINADPADVRGILDLLATRGYVVRDEVNLYWLGPRITVLGAQASPQNALMYAARDILDDLLATGAHNVALIMRQGTEAFRLAYREGGTNPQLLRLPPFVPSSGPLFTGGASKLLLAFAPQPVIDEVIEKHLHEFLPPTLRSRASVLQLLEQIRQDGYYIAVAEIHPEVFTINAPVRDARSELVASLGCMGVVQNLTPASRQEMIATICDAAQRLSRRLR